MCIDYNLSCVSLLDPGTQDQRAPERFAQLYCKQELPVEVVRPDRSEAMPFTVAHAAAALPFRRLNLVWSAFLVGSMAPDFPYVIGTVKYRSLGHEFPGVVLFTLPASFVVLWFFHLAIKRPVAGLLPIGVQERLSGQLGEFKFGGMARFPAIAFSIILGIATHL